MLPLEEIRICKADAINYYRGDDQDFLNKIFFSDIRFKKVLDSKIYFLQGDKGTGKTAFAVYNSNNETENIKSSLKFTSETDFKKFIRLIESGKINISDFVGIWKVILLLLISQEVESILDGNLITNFLTLSKLDKAIKKYYKSAFFPEISNAIEIIDKADIFLEILKNIKTGASSSEKIEKTGLQINLHEIEYEFKNALMDVKLKKSFILFVDGTDQIPFDIKRDKYVECLRGLANAIWELNQLFFPEIFHKKHSTNFIKIVLLIRPDIFSIIRFHNANAKLKDNSVLLSWITTESTYKISRLFKMIDNSLASQQSSKFALGYSWDVYVDKTFEICHANKTEILPSFVAILRRTFMRPRDLFAFLDIMQSRALRENSKKITSKIFNSSIPEFSRYLLGEVKDQFNFFHDDYEWGILFDFFNYFDGMVKFDFPFFEKTFNRFLEDYPSENPDVFESSFVLLQSLYNSNIICYIEYSNNETFYHWSYKEKSYTNIEPLVEYGSEYQFHSGLLKAMGLGQKINRKRF